MRRLAGTWPLAGALMSAVLWAAGCSTQNPPCVVAGTVQMNNAPVGGVYVVLHGENGAPAGTGRTGTDGTFRLTVQQEGEYPITCFCPKVTKLMDDVIEGGDYFQGRYRDWQKPPAKAVVKSGENSLPPILLQ